MKLRRNYLMRQETIGDTATIVRNIDYNAPISAIVVSVKAKTDTPDDGALPLLRALENLQIVSSNGIIQGANGHLIQGMNYLHPGGIGVNDSSENTTAEYAAAQAIFFFGHRIGDPEFYLDPTMEKNLQIRFVNTILIAAGDYTTGTTVVSVEVITIEEGAGPRRGTFFLKEIAVDTLAANGTVRSDLPVDMPYAILGYFMENSSNVMLHPDKTCLNIKLTENNDAFIAYDKRVLHLWQENIRDFGYFKVLEEELDDLAVKSGYGMVMANITLESQYSCPYGVVGQSFLDPITPSFYTIGMNDSLQDVFTGGGTGGQVRTVAMQVQLP